MKLQSIECNKEGAYIEGEGGGGYNWKGFSVTKLMGCINGRFMSEGWGEGGYSNKGDFMVCEVMTLIIYNSHELCIFCHLCTNVTVTCHVPQYSNTDFLQFGKTNINIYIPCIYSFFFLHINAPNRL